MFLHVDIVPENKRFIPEYKSKGAAGLDLVADLRYVGGPITIFKQNGTVIVSTGIKVAIPSAHVGIVAIRSSLAVAGLRLVNGIGVIDSDYRGTIKLAVESSKDPIKINHCDRIAQIFIVPCPRIQFNVVEDLQASTRGEGGFGSTGT